MKEHSRWYSGRIERDVSMVRWGHYGAPVLIFPTAGGDAEECERMGLVGALWGLVEEGRIKVYSVDSVAGRAWIENDDPLYCTALQNRFDDCVASEVVPAIRNDCKDDAIEVIATGASIGAFNAVASICRHPELFRLAIGMSGTYDLEPWLHGQWTDAFHFLSPKHFLPGLEGAQLETLRYRFVLMATGEGAWEDPGESWRMADLLGSRGIPNRVDSWGPDYPHDWQTWREMLPRYLGEMV